jgi:hypothetical protein
MTKALYILEYWSVPLRQGFGGQDGVLEFFSAKAIIEKVL